METKRIVLTAPFVRLPAGTVLELSADLDVQGWDPDNPTLEKNTFLGKVVYNLPDGGNGMAYALPISDVVDCPEGIFDESMLHTGPCRITRAAYAREGASDDKWNTGFDLLEQNGYAAQRLQFSPANLSAPPVEMELYDRLRGDRLVVLPGANTYDSGALGPGFYEIRLHFERGDPYSIYWMKAFPLIVLFERRGGAFTTVKTLY